MKLDKQRFIVCRVYSWSVRQTDSYCFSGYVNKFSGRSTATNIGDNQVLNTIFHDYSFMDFFKARKYCRQHPDKYSFYWEKKEYDI